VVEASQELERGRTSFERRAWLDAYTALTEADRLEPLGAADLDLLATSASLLGRMDDYLTVLERAHLAHLERGDNLAAARAAGWLGMTLAIRGELGPASGWFGRAQRLVEREGARVRRAGLAPDPRRVPARGLRRLRRNERRGGPGGRDRGAVR
jgi:hypothetical protein